MSAPTSMPIPEVPDFQHNRSIDIDDMIERLATEMRARTAGELPQDFYVDQVKRRLSGRTMEVSLASQRRTRGRVPEHASVFHSWAISE